MSAYVANPNTCPECGFADVRPASTSGIVTGRPPREISTDSEGATCPSCGAHLRRRPGQSWRLAWDA